MLRIISFTNGSNLQSQIGEAVEKELRTALSLSYAGGEEDGERDNQESTDAS